MPATGLRGKVVLLTGAAGGIGAAVEAAFLKAGARVVSADLSFPDPGRGPAAWTDNPVRLGLEVTDKGGVEALVALAVRQWGSLDVVVNAAGVLNVKPILEISEQEWDRTFAVNVKGLFFVCQCALRQMMRQRAGCMVNIASVSGKLGGVLAGADYSASKAAVICLTKSLAKAGAPYGIRVNSVAPGAVHSPMLQQYYQDHAEEMKRFEAGHPRGGLRSRAFPGLRAGLVHHRGLPGRQRRQPDGLGPHSPPRGGCLRKTASPPCSLWPRKHNQFESSCCG